MMEDLQVLVAAMHQEDLSLAARMNLQCDAIIANQADREETAVEVGSLGTTKMLTTKTRGVGLNRNLALLAATSEIVLFADEDVTYYDGMPAQVVEAFKKTPDADVILFSMDYARNGKIIEKRHLPHKKLHVWNSMRYGAVSMAARRSALLRCNIMFHQLFGGGCLYNSGEDSLFLKACFEKGLHVYSHPYVLGICSRDSSTWFSGCDEKYFYDKGALMGYLFPKLKYAMTLYFAIHVKKKTDIACFERIRWMYSGLRGGRAMISYNEFLKDKKK